jgi:lipoprotein-anchoring transpeptidase ErfK/SrfK
MLRFVFPLLLTATIPAFSQQSTVQPATRPVRQSPPPHGGDAVLVSRRIPGAVATAPIAPPPPSESLPPASPLDEKPTGDDALRLQIFLDEANFGPGVIDGKPGRFTELAVYSWNEVHGYPVNDWIAVNTAARKAIPRPLAVAFVPDVVKDWVDPDLPTKPSQQAKKKRMSYRSVGELMAERYHSDETYLATLNGSRKMNKLKARDSIIVPNITPFYIEKLSEIRHEADPALSNRHVVVDTKMNQARIFEATPAALVVAEPGAAETTRITRANHGLLASFPITPGQPKFIKFGTWDLRGMVELPYWRYDPQLLDTGKRGSDSLNIPPGPNSPVGVIWNGLSKPGIGLHGTGTPETIGRARSHGCIRLANWDAIRLPNLIRPGTTVEVR